MTTTFDSREHSFENKFAHDREVEFKILARGNYLLGLWAADKMQLAADAAEEYAKSMVDETVNGGPKANIREKIQNDFSAAGVEISQKDIENEMGKFLQLAKDQITNIG